MLLRCLKDKTVPSPAPSSSAPEKPPINKKKKKTATPPANKPKKPVKRKAVDSPSGTVVRKVEKVHVPDDDDEEEEDSDKENRPPAAKRRPPASPSVAPALRLPRRTSPSKVQTQTQTRRPDSVFYLIRHNKAEGALFNLSLTDPACPLYARLEDTNRPLLRVHETSLLPSDVSSSSSTAHPVSSHPKGKTIDWKLLVVGDRLNGAAISDPETGQLGEVHSHLIAESHSDAKNPDLATVVAVLHQQETQQQASQSFVTPVSVIERHGYNRGRLFGGPAL